MLVSLSSILKAARKGRYAVGAFNCLSIEQARGAVAAAVQLRSPLILQVAEVQFPCAPMELMAPVFLRLAVDAPVPVCVHLDHGQCVETCLRAMELGFNSVMFDGAALPFEENVRNTKEVVRAARVCGVDVEAELGRVGDAGTADEGAQGADIFTDPAQAEEFVRQTGADALAIAIGNLHGKYIATPKLNIERLREIAGRIDTPLVLHGGSGTSIEDFKACVHNGICKINVATALQIAAADALYGGKKTDYIGMKNTIEEATRKAVSWHMDLFESVGRA